MIAQHAEIRARHDTRLAWSRSVWYAYQKYKNIILCNVLSKYKDYDIK